MDIKSAEKINSAYLELEDEEEEGRMVSYCEGRKNKSLIISQPLQSSSVQPVGVIRMDLVKHSESKGSA